MRNVRKWYDIQVWRGAKCCGSIDLGEISEETAVKIETEINSFVKGLSSNAYAKLFVFEWVA